MLIGSFDSSMSNEWLQLLADCVLADVFAVDPQAGRAFGTNINEVPRRFIHGESTLIQDRLISSPRSMCRMRREIALLSIFPRSSTNCKLSEVSIHVALGRQRWGRLGVRFVLEQPVQREAEARDDFAAVDVRRLGQDADFGRRGVDVHLPRPGGRRPTPASYRSGSTLPPFPGSPRRRSTC